MSRRQCARFRVGRPAPSLWDGSWSGPLAWVRAATVPRPSQYRISPCDSNWIRHAVRCRAAPFWQRSPHTANDPTISAPASRPRDPGQLTFWPEETVCINFRNISTPSTSRPSHGPLTPPHARVGAIGVSMYPPPGWSREPPLPPLGTPAHSFTSEVSYAFTHTALGGL